MFLYPGADRVESRPSGMRVGDRSATPCFPSRRDSWPRDREGRVLPLLPPGPGPALQGPSTTTRSERRRGERFGEADATGGASKHLLMAGSTCGSSRGGTIHARTIIRQIVRSVIGSEIGRAHV